MMNQPYKGLNPYEEPDKDNFFGRTSDIRILSDKIRARKLTFLFAASGVGKSSLLQAGVMPELKQPTRKHYKPLDVIYYRDWVLNPLETFIEKAIADLKAQGKLSPTYELDHFDSLKAFLQFCTLFSSDPLVVIFDQFEEFFYYQRYRSELTDFVKELSAAIHDEDTATAFVISMREDSALELNAFKAHIPTFLIENFYRLEKLTKDQANAAVVEPVKRLGFAYESELLELLLQDLGQREWRDRHGEQEAFPSDAPLLIEAPHLQIICEQLWALDGSRADQQMTLATYQREGRTEGLLKKYFYGIVGGFSRQERKLASLAFTLLVSRYGTKLARPLSELAKSSRQDEQALGQVLQKLDDRRILRRQNRQGQYWYELYHDVLAKHVYDWNEGYKRRQFIKKSLLTLAAVGVSFAGLVVGVDYYQNATQVHFRLSPKSGVSDVIEVYQGKLKSFDWFEQQGYRYETDYARSDIEADKLFVRQPIMELAKLNSELIARVPLSSRVAEYKENAEFKEAHCLALANGSNPTDFRTIADVNWWIQRQKNRKISVTNYYGYDTDTYKVRLPFSKLTEYLQNEGLRGIAISLMLQYSGNEKNEKVVQPLIAMLKDENADIRSHVAGGLGNLENTDAVQPLIAMLKDADSNVRSSVAAALGNLKNADAIQPLITALKDEDSNVRSSVAVALGNLKNADAVQPLITALKDDNSSVRGNVAEALGNLENTDAVQPLITALKDEDSNVRSSVAVALGNLKNADAVQPLITALKDENSNVRGNVAEALGNLKNADVVQPLIIVASNDKNESVRVNAINALGSLGNANAVQPLIVALKDENQGVRFNAVVALEVLGNASAVQPLINRLFKEEDSSVRSITVRTLKNLVSVSEIVQSLIAGSKDNDHSNIAEALGLLESPEAIELLISLLNHEKENVRSTVAWSLARLGNIRGIQPLVTLLEEKNENTQDSIVKALGRLGDVRVLQSLITTMLKGEMSGYNISVPYVRHTRSGLLLGTEQYLSYNSEGTNYYVYDEWGDYGVASIIGELGSVEAVSYLLDNNAVLKQLGITTFAEDLFKEQESEDILLDSLMKQLIDGENINTQRKAIKSLEKILEADRLPSPVPPKLGEEKDAFGHPSTLKPLEILATPTTVTSDSQKGVEVVAPKKLTAAEKADIQAKLAEIIQNPQTIFGVRADALRAIAQFHTEEVAQFIIKTLQQAKKDADTNLNQKYFVANTLQALGINGHKIALSLLQQELADLTRQKQHWRKQRDTETAPLATPEFTCNDDQKPSETTDDQGQWPKESWEIVLGQAIARVDPENAGLKLLRHDLTNVRQGTRFGLAQVATAQLIEKLNQQREQSKSYPNDLDEVMFVHSAYRALDEMLIALETIGTEQDFKHLRKLYPQLQDDSVKQRVEWTIGQLEYQYSD